VVLLRTASDRVQTDVDFIVHKVGVPLQQPTFVRVNQRKDVLGHGEQERVFAREQPLEHL